jgi:peptidyl-prolyl cis-trans isomerase SurA
MRRDGRERRPRRQWVQWGLSMNRHILAAAAVAAAFALFACKHAPPANVAAEVNGRAITFSDLDKAYQSQPQPPETTNEDQQTATRLDILNSLITSEIMLQQAEKLGLAAVDADVEAKFNEMKAPYTKEEFQRRLTERHMTEADLRTQLRRELTLNKLINKEITSHISITDADVANFYAANKSAYNHPEPLIHMAQILVTPVADPNVRNLKNSKAQSAKEAQQKIEDISARLQRGEDFAQVAQNFSEDSNTAPNGGDMGLIPESNLDKASPDLKRLILSLQPGVASRPIATPNGYMILKVISREPAGQRELSDPRVQQDIRETLMTRKDQLLKAAYYEVARNRSKIVNYVAQSVVENAGKTK